MPGEQIWLGLKRSNSSTSTCIGYSSCAGKLEYSDGTVWSGAQSWFQIGLSAVAENVRYIFASANK